MRILVDMDGVIANFEGGFLNNWREQYPDKPFVPLEQRTTSRLVDQYPKELKDLVESIIYAPGFFLKLEPIQGSVEALQEMRTAGIDIFICSSPLSVYKNCVVEKYEWVETHLGNDWIQRLILTKDKTLIRGDILIDDRPELDGIDNPSWEHIIYDQPYNRVPNNKKRMSWQTWKTVLFSNSY